LRFYVSENDATLTAGLTIAGQADDNGEVDVTIGAGSGSTTTVAGDLTVSGTITGTISFTDIAPTGDIDMATGKKITWVDDNQYISGTATGITIEADDTLVVNADTSMTFDAPSIIVTGSITCSVDLDIEGDIDMATGKKITWVNENQYISGTATGNTAILISSNTGGSDPTGITLSCSSNASNIVIENAPLVLKKIQDYDMSDKNDKLYNVDGRLKWNGANLKTGIKRFAEYIAGRTNSGNVDGLTYIDENNEVVAWGDGDNYSIGLDQSLKTPGTTIPLPPDAIGVASKVYRAQNLLGILTSNNEMYFMGSNIYKQFSYSDDSGDTNNYLMKICSVSNVKKICFGPYKTLQVIYYVTNDNKLWAAGRNYYGVLGNGASHASNQHAAYETQSSGVEDAVLVGDDGDEVGCCLFTDGTVKTVGYGGRGQIGDGNTGNHNTWQSPVYDGGTTALANIVEIQGCGFDSYTTLYALDSSGVLYGWGSNVYGELSTGNQTAQNKAVVIGSIGGLTITDFWACGSYAGNALFVKYSNNKIYACGRNSIGQLGLSAASVVTTLTEVTSLPTSYNIKEIILAGGSDTNTSHTFAITEDDRILASGNNVQGQCSMGTTVSLGAFELCYTILNNSGSPIKLKSGISRNNPYIDLKHLAGLGGQTFVISNNNEVYTCGYPRYFNGTVDNEYLYYLTRAKHW
jgi:alpha-tubulin suppressor-like RCC1 family protein